jgi:hypothetical protein
LNLASAPGGRVLYHLRIAIEESGFNELFGTALLLILLREKLLNSGLIRAFGIIIGLDCS